MELLDDNYCFACGRKNPIGLKLEFDFSDDCAGTKFTPGKEHQGWINVIHGGILFTLMDELMARMLIDKGHNVVSSRIDVRFLRPAETGKELTVTAKIEKKMDKQIQASSRIANDRGKTIASARGVYVKI